MLLHIFKWLDETVAIIQVRCFRLKRRFISGRFQSLMSNEGNEICDSLQHQLLV